MPIKETQIQTAIINLLAVYENQGKLFFNRTNNIPPVNKDRETGKRFKKNGAEYYIVRSVEEVKKILAL